MIFLIGTEERGMIQVKAEDEIAKPPQIDSATEADAAAEREVKAIITRIKKGDKRAFAELVDRYRNQVAALAYKMVGDYDEAADIVQNVFVKTSQNIWRYDESKRFYTWLYRITVNAAIDYMRKHRRHRHESLENVHESTESRRDNPEGSFRANQLREYISAATEKLNGKQRSAFILRDIEGCQIDDVANIMDMPEATVRWYLHRARQKIRKDLLRRCPGLLIALGIK
jgi:RNA polymerase sigma-70 factor (ECF subfamily)